VAPGHRRLCCPGWSKQPSLPRKKEIVRPRNIQSKAAKACKIFLGTLAGTERVRRVKSVDFTPADCRAWTRRGKLVLQAAGREGRNGERADVGQGVTS